jgi:hypothetical protein
MRIHCLENVDKALQFLKEQKVHLENMGSHDIVDGNHRLTLGLVWTIILRFQVSSECYLRRKLYMNPSHTSTLLLMAHGKINTNTEVLER